MTFHADISHAWDEANMAQWEMWVYEFSRQLNTSLIERLGRPSPFVACATCRLCTRTRIARPEAEGQTRARAVATQCAERRTECSVALHRSLFICHHRIRPQPTDENSKKLAKSTFTHKQTHCFPFFHAHN
ncbi:hypothetical protein niasHT_016067 [Heterodera trifolii]|uniref:Uncharacterized protein n=1 Tax=Heterodera trifolii TaxID=157864 RepID=A0ABD2LB01_9BILA